MSARDFCKRERKTPSTVRNCVQVPKQKATMFDCHCLSYNQDASSKMARSTVVRNASPGFGGIWQRE